MVCSEDIKFKLETLGYVLMSSGLSVDECARAVTFCDTVEIGRGGVRNLLERDWVQAIANHSSIRSAVDLILGKKAFAFKAILFDKSADSNWKVPWHQDISVPVYERREEAGWGPWTVKAGVLHVQAPAPVLEQILAVRVHLDAVTAENGPMRVIPGSHLAGRINESGMVSWRSKPEVVCIGEQGSLLLMKPLLLHASSLAISPSHRRVLHLEFGAEILKEMVSELARA